MGRPNDSMPPAWPARPARRGLTSRKALALVGLALAAVVVIAGAAALLFRSPAGATPPPQGSTALASATTTPTVTPAATATVGSTTVAPTATPNADATFIAQFGQSCAAGANEFAGATTIQGVALTPLVFMLPNYPGYELSPTLPDAPLKWPDPAINQQTLPVANPWMDPTTNSDATVMFRMAICNTTNASLSLAQVWLKNTAFTPFTGPLNETRQCGQVYSRQAGLTGGGCGGGSGVQLSWVATLTSANGAAQATIASGQGQTVTLPLPIPPKNGLIFNINLTLPIGGQIAAGTYSFATGIALGNGPVIYDTAQSPAAIYAVPTLWNGANCQSQSLQQQIPTTNPQQTYICPGD